MADGGGRRECNLKAKKPRMIWGCIDKNRGGKEATIIDINIRIRRRRNCGRRRSKKKSSRGSRSNSRNRSGRRNGMYFSVDI